MTKDSAADVTDQSVPESHQQVNDKFPSQTAEVEFVSHYPVHEQTVITRSQILLNTDQHHTNEQPMTPLIIIIIRFIKIYKVPKALASEAMAAGQS